MQVPLPAVSAFPTLTPSVSAKEVAMSGWKTLFREEELFVVPPPPSYFKSSFHCLLLVFYGFNFGLMKGEIVSQIESKYQQNLSINKKQISCIKKKNGIEDL